MMGLEFDPDDKERPRCPHCGSGNVLPHEENPTPRRQDSMVIVFLAAALVMGGYLLILITSNLSFPLFLIGVVAVSSWLIRKQERGKKRKIQKQKMFVCLECNQNFPLWTDM